MTEILAWMANVPRALVYLILAGGAALENVVPAVPADTFVALGGFLAGAGELDARWVAVTTWLANVAGAMTVYGLSRRHGPTFFDRGWGRYLMRPHQMQRLERFYDRWGLPAIFLSRFIPGVRAIVPVFAGATSQTATSVAVPIVIASAIWYGALVALGLWAGQNVQRLSEMLAGVNRSLAWVAAVIVALAVAWWLRSRRAPERSASVDSDG